MAHFPDQWQRDVDFVPGFIPWFSEFNVLDYFIENEKKLHGIFALFESDEAVELVFTILPLLHTNYVGLNVHDRMLEA